jgi:hypothetical protein
MTSLSVAFVYQSPAAHPGQGMAVYSRFVAELGQHAASPLETFGRLHEVPESAFIIFAGDDARATLESYPVDQRPSIAARLIPINASRPRIFERLLEPLSIPGAIDSMSLLEWEMQNSSTKGTRGLYGLREIGNAAGAECRLFESKHYCFLQSATHTGLPHLLADYLLALLSVRKGM